MKQYLVFNFKNNPQNLAQLDSVLKIYHNFEEDLNQKFSVVLLPPTLYLLKAQEILKKSFLWGSQNVFWHSKIAITGEVTPQMLRASGVKVVLIGHSERREYLQENNEMINFKIKACLAQDLIPLLCVGEKTKSPRIKLDFKSKQEIFNDLNYAFRGVKLETGEKVMIAYEPRWAIGTDLIPDQQNLEEIMKLIRFWLSRRFSESWAKQIPLLYGGSVTSQNIISLLKIKNVNGVLIGRTATKPSELNQLLKTLIN